MGRNLVCFARHVDGFVVCGGALLGVVELSEVALELSKKAANLEGGE